MPLLLFSSRVMASNTIASYLIETEFSMKDGGLWKKDGIFLVDTKVDNILEIDYEVVEDYAIVLSPHSSKSKIPTLTVHVPGNWNEALYGGKPYTLNISYATLMWFILHNMSNYVDTKNLDYEVSYEVDHHGPTVQYPIMFVELGSAENNWKDKKAASVVGDAVMDAINEVKRVKNIREIYVGLGGNHYASKFTKIALSEETAFSHLMPKYAVFDERLAEQAYEKSIEKCLGFLIDKKGFNSEKRKNIIQILKNLDYEYEIV